MSFLSCEIVAGVLPHADEAVLANWPHIAAALELEGIESRLCEIAAAATIDIETAYTFNPIVELGGAQYFAKHYDNRVDLGNIHPGDGFRYRGRGFVQLTGLSNYRAYSTRVGADLVANPDLACEPLVAAHLFACYFKDHGIYKLAEAKNWQLVRRRVNGGLNGFDRFMAIVNQLLKSPAEVAVKASAAGA